MIEREEVDPPLARSFDATRWFQRMPNGGTVFQRESGQLAATPPLVSEMPNGGGRIRQPRDVNAIDRPPFDAGSRMVVLEMPNGGGTIYRPANPNASAKPDAGGGENGDLAKPK